MCVFAPPVSPFRADTPLTSAGGKGAVRRFKQLDKLKFEAHGLNVGKGSENDCVKDISFVQGAKARG